VCTKFDIYVFILKVLYILTIIPAFFQYLTCTNGIHKGRITGVTTYMNTITDYFMYNFIDNNLQFTLISNICRKEKLLCCMHTKLHKKINLWSILIAISVQFVWRRTITIKEIRFYFTCHLSLAQVTDFPTIGKIVFNKILSKKWYTCI